MEKSSINLKYFLRTLCLFIIWNHSLSAIAQQIKLNGLPKQLNISAPSENSVRIILKPASYKEAMPDLPILAENVNERAVMNLQSITQPVRKQVGKLTVTITPDPLKIDVTNSKGQRVQTIIFKTDGTFTFTLDDQPVLGLGEGGPASPVNSIIPEPVEDWNNQQVEFDRRGRLLKMQPRPQGGAYGSRNPVALLAGTSGWGLFIPTPWGQIDLRGSEGVFTPVEADGSEASPDSAAKQKNNRGIIPSTAANKGLYDIFVFDAHDPVRFMKDVSAITGQAVMPPKWSMGYMQSFRTLQDEKQMLGIVDTFRMKKLPVDAMIYLGTGFVERGWNTPQPSFDFNPAVFHRQPQKVLADLHARNVKVVMHIWPWEEDLLPSLQGSIPAKPGEKIDASHIQNYWQEHEPLLKAGVDGFWPDAGDRFNLFERLKRHQLYYEGPLSAKQNVRPWSLHRNGYVGIAKWGGWVWSGDIISSWKTLEAQVAVGINHSLSLSPYWGTDIGGFFPNKELTGELYARWFQFGAFCPLFRSHGKTWSVRLPWGWGKGSMGVLEGNKGNEPLVSELNNPAIEPICRTYDNLRYQLLPYNYSLAWEARNSGLPLMRALWLHYPNDPMVRNLGSEYLWGSDLLIAPVFEKGASTRKVYLPEGNWYDWWTNTKQTGKQTISRSVNLSVMPIYVREGAIIPVDPIRQYTSEPVNDATTLRIYSGSNGRFTLYDDDGTSLEYVKGKSTIINISWDEKNRELILEPSPDQTINDPGYRRVFKLELLPKGVVGRVEYRGKRVTTKLPL